ncbi:hypothetical protein [Streptomyces narbonensis]|uniref:hypothetical protein n=1 Tax=Streptomyces narbonensis TaxID=67333 RepID=UPI003F5419A9
MLVIESWVINDDSPVPVSSVGVVEALRSRIDSGQLETWLTSSPGRLLAFVTNAERAMVVLLEGEGDPGEHAVDPETAGSSGRTSGGRSLSGLSPCPDEDRGEVERGLVGDGELVGPHGQAAPLLEPVDAAFD